MRSMARRRYEVELKVTVTVDIDDQVTSEYYEGETLLTAHTNPERFKPGSDHETAIAALAITDGLWHSRDGWADFPREAYWTNVSGDVDVEDVTFVGEVEPYQAVRS